MSMKGKICRGGQLTCCESVAIVRVDADQTVPASIVNATRTSADFCKCQSFITRYSHKPGRRLWLRRSALNALVSVQSTLLLAEDA